eukprot:scaffold5472_cov146-Skeletonema_menzelii.AAC.13
MTGLGKEEVEDFVRLPIDSLTILPTIPLHVATRHSQFPVHYSQSEASSQSAGHSHTLAVGLIIL